MEMLELATDLKGARAEIIRLREELANIRKENESGLCACEYDSPDDVCMYHSSLVKRLRAELAVARSELAVSVGHLSRLAQGYGCEDFTTAVDDALAAKGE